MSSDKIIYNKSVTLLQAFNEAGLTIYIGIKDYLEALVHFYPLVYAYHRTIYDPDQEYLFYHAWFPDEMQNEDTFIDFSSKIQRLHYVLENYSNDNELMWTMLAYIWENNIGDEYALSIYERDCQNDEEYIKIGRIIKKVLPPKKIFK